MGENMQKEKSGVDSLQCSEIITMKISCDCKVNDEEVHSVFADFQALDFENNPCNNPTDKINYNEGEETDPFSKIRKYYDREKNIFLFISMLEDKEQLRKIEDIIDQKCDAAAKAKFLKRMKIYLDRIQMGRNDVKEYFKINAFPDSFTHGPYHGDKRNVHQNLNINFTKPEQSIEISSIFNTKVERAGEVDSGVKKIKVYSNGRRVAAVSKSENLQRRYSFNKDCSCHLFISWEAKDEHGRDRHCSVLLDINDGKIGNVEFKIDGEQAEVKEDLVKQNDDVIVKGKLLHEVLQ